MGDFENNFLMLLGFLVFCYILSVLLYKPKNHNHKQHFGYKCMEYGCVKVNQPPNMKKGIFSNPMSCIESCSTNNCFPVDNLGQSGYICTLNGCQQVDMAPNKDLGIFSNAQECLSNCGKQVLGQSGYACTLYGCKHVDMAPNKDLGVFSNAEECAYNCGKKVLGQSGYKCTPSGCDPVDLAPDKESGIFSNAEECAYNCNQMKNFQSSGPGQDIINCMKKCGNNNPICVENCNFNEL